MFTHLKERIKQKWASFDPQAKITPAERRRGLPFAILDGPASQTMETLASGPFLVAYALALGANNLVIGLLAAMPFLGNFAQAPGAYLVEKYKKRKKTTLIISFFGRPMFLIAASLAFMPTSPVLPWILVLCFFGRYFFGCASGCSWNSWIKDFIPVRIQGRYYANRLKYMTIAIIGCNLLGAFAVDFWDMNWPDKKIYAYTVLLLGAFIAGLSSTYFMSQVPEPDMQRKEDSVSFFKKFIEPFKVQNFRRLMTFLGMWNFGLNLVAPFFTVVMIQVMHISLTTVVLLTILSQISSLFIISIWGAIADRFSNKSVLFLAVPVYITSIILWIFTTLPDTHSLTMPILIVIYILIGIATAGVNLSTNNIALKLAPKGRAATYISANSVVNALCAGTAPILGGGCADYFKNIELSIIVQWKTASENLMFQTMSISHWDFFFMFAALIGSISLIFLTRVKEQGEVQESIVLQEFLSRTRRSFSNMTTLTGLKSLSVSTKMKKPVLPPDDDMTEEQIGWGS